LWSWAALGVWKVEDLWREGVREKGREGGREKGREGGREGVW
jgi:hypothetical protein